MNAFRKQFAIALGAIVVLGLVIDLNLQTFLNQRHHWDQITETALRMSTVRARIEETIFANLLLIKGMAAYISVHPDLKDDEFKLMVERLMDQPNLLMNMAAAPDFVITYVYPLAGNEEVLNRDYRKLPNQWDQARLARDTDQMVVAGPLKLVQGGTGLIGRTPVFYVDDRGERKFWGLVSAVIDMDRLYQTTRLNSPETGLELALRGRNGKGTAGEVFYGPAELFGSEADSVKLDIIIPSGKWQMAGRPQDGWERSHPAAWPIHLTLIGLVIAASLIAFRRLKYVDLLRQARAGLAEAQSVALLGSWEWDIASDRITWSEEVYRLFEVDPGAFELTKDNYLNLIHPEDRPLLIAALEQSLASGQSYEIEHRIVLPEGRIKHLHGLGRVSSDQSGRPVRMVGTIQDVTEKVKAETALRENREMLQSMSQAAHDAMIIIKADDRIIFWNRAAEKMFGYTAKEALGQRMHLLIAAEEEDVYQAHDGLARFAVTGTGPVMNTIQEFMAVRRDGSLFPVERSVAAFRRGEEWYAVGSLRDITERREAQAKLEELATMDGLTGLYNRRHFYELAQTQLIQARRYGQPLGLIMFDVDFFKSVNDKYGHDIGDAVLRCLARTTVQTIREVDFCGRLGGEEFAVCLPETDFTGTRETAERLRLRIAAEEVDHSEGTLSVTVSLGVVQLSSHDADLESLLKRADEALYQAKEGGRNRVEPALNDKSNPNGTRGQDKTQ